MFTYMKDPTTARFKKQCTDLVLNFLVTVKIRHAGTEPRNDE
jgi:hypothetical protein